MLVYLQTTLLVITPRAVRACRVHHHLAAHLTMRHAASSLTGRDAADLDKHAAQPLRKLLPLRRGLDAESHGRLYQP